jgi:NAD(P)-dependent dehydrogenase (short-subunit alcohol dehydrogenase family)
MASEQKVAVITGASQGIGASLVKGFREIGYGVVATSRSIRASEFASDAEILVIDGDIAAALLPTASSARPSSALGASTRW